MSEDRSVHTDALHTLGMMIGPDEKRDAIHLAVEPCIAAENKLYPGQHVGFVDGGMGTKTSKFVGIVDPFLTSAVDKGQRFWLIVYPRQITSLRHVWSHPEFSEEEIGEPAPGESEARLRSFAGGIGVSYDDLLYHAKDYVDHGEYWVQGDRFEGQGVPDNFWNDFEAVTGKKIAVNNRGSFFSCAC